MAITKRFLLVLVVSSVTLGNGEQYYLNKQYDQAKSTYELALSNAPNNAAYHYNLAAVLYRQNQLIPAKIHFLESQALLPNNVNIHHNLSIINATFIDKNYAGHTPFNWHVFGLNAVVIQNIALLLMSMGILWLILRRFIFINPYLDRVGMLGVVIVSIIGGIVCIASLQLNDYGVVTDQKVSVFSGPSKTQQPLFNVHEGAEFKVLDMADHWLNIQFNNGLKGWVETVSVHIL